jgi:hypothetical protein
VGLKGKEGGAVVVVVEDQCVTHLACSLCGEKTTTRKERAKGYGPGGLGQRREMGRRWGKKKRRPGRGRLLAKEGWPG